MTQDIKTTCDICRGEGDRFPSWFYIETKTKSVGPGLITMIPDKVTYEGYARYPLSIDLCPKHRDEIIEAVQNIVDKATISQH